MSKRTKITAIVIVVAAAAIIAAGATLAFFTADGGAKTNTFSTGSVTVNLSEPTWDQTGKAQAEKYGPGDIIPKDPQVTNTDKTDAWVAVKVKYSLNGDNNFLSYSDFKSKLLANDGLDFDLNNWDLLKDEGTNGQLYVYKTVLKQGQTTKALFTQVPIAFGNIEMINGQLPSFAIDAQGFGVQAENITSEQAKEELLKLAFK